MNKIKVMPGQVWESTSLFKDCIIITIDMALTDKFICENYEFVPQTDLEWLAVNVDWSDLHPVIKPVPCHINIIYRNKVFILKGVRYTKKQWQNKRYELGLGEPFIDNSVNVYGEHKPFINTTNWINIIYDEVKKMNEIKIPISWQKGKGIELVVGDEWLSINGSNGKIKEGDITWFNGDKCFYLDGENVGEQVYITSFAERENDGKQPVADWVPIICYSSTEDNLYVDFLAGKCCWDKFTLFDIKKWKPNIEALNKIYLAEQKEKEIKKEKFNKKIPKPDSITWTTSEDFEKEYFRKEQNEKEFNYIVDFFNKNELNTHGETISQSVIRELEEKHDIDTCTEDEKNIDNIAKIVSQIRSIIPMDGDPKFIAELLHKAGVKWVGE